MVFAKWFCTIFFGFCKVVLGGTHTHYFPPKNIFWGKIISVCETPTPTSTTGFFPQGKKNPPSMNFEHSSSKTCPLNTCPLNTCHDPPLLSCNQSSVNPPTQHHTKVLMHDTKTPQLQIKYLLLQKMSNYPITCNTHTHTHTHTHTKPLTPFPS